MNFLSLSEYGGGVKLYNTAKDKSNFTLTVFTENLDCEQRGISVYVDQILPEHFNTNINSKHILGSFKKLKLFNSGNNQCKYISVSDRLWPYVFIKVFNDLGESNVKLCEVTFE